ncbi:hypothetical protein [Alkalicoccus luteus]|uniref:Uncharacterized protein n=1 Tax=Alkalicoccus luteus TaxID=1237094 RepID=A0A969PRB3_9BACI|nr:hypothetical protein [Alkalicoccus luteus]NJP38990.1 hypothetical protein [Alkalicoccus luteus]
MEMLRYEHGIVKEFGDQEAIVSTPELDYHLKLTEEENGVIQMLLLEKETVYVLVDTEEKRIVFENVLESSEHANPELIDLENDAVDENGFVK